MLLEVLVFLFHELLLVHGLRDLSSCAKGVNRVLDVSLLHQVDSILSKFRRNKWG